MINSNTSITISDSYQIANNTSDITLNSAKEKILKGNHLPYIVVLTLMTIFSIKSPVSLNANSKDYAIENVVSINASRSIQQQQEEEKYSFITAHGFSEDDYTYTDFFDEA